LKRVLVRLLLEHERPEFDRLLTEKHYLHDWVLTGQSLRYVAELDGQWVALISFSAASFHLKAREKWIAWSPRQRARRLPFVVNNSRFLVLPERQRYPNLASRVLGLCRRRLNADWQERWQHPVLAVESFVDESHSAVTHHLRLTLDQIPIEEKSNEIPALKPLLKKINPPPGVLITADALHCQQERARFITQELGGDHLFGLKGNQSGIFDKAKRRLAQQAFPPCGPS